MYSSVWRWWYLNIYSIFVRSYLFHYYVYCRRPKRKMQLSIIWMLSCVFCILLLTLWLYSSLNKKIRLKNAWRQTERQTGRQTHAYQNKINLFLTQHDPHHYYLPFPCFHHNAKHISIYSTLWNMTHYPVAWSYVCINNTTMITIKKKQEEVWN